MAEPVPDRPVRLRTKFMNSAHHRRERPVGLVPIQRRASATTLLPDRTESAGRSRLRARPERAGALPRSLRAALAGGLCAAWRAGLARSLAPVAGARRVRGPWRRHRGHAHPRATGSVRGSGAGLGNGGAERRPIEKAIAKASCVSCSGNHHPVSGPCAVDPVGARMRRAGGARAGRMWRYLEEKAAAAKSRPR